MAKDLKAFEIKHPNTCTNCGEVRFAAGDKVWAENADAANSGRAWCAGCAGEKPAPLATVAPPVNVPPTKAKG